MLNIVKVVTTLSHNRPDAMMGVTGSIERQVSSGKGERSR
jgi:hypothetical protein